MGSGGKRPRILFQILGSFVDAVNKKVKQSHYRPGKAQISRQSAHESGKVVSPTHQPHLPPRKYFWYSFLLEVESILGP